MAAQENGSATNHLSSGDGLSKDILLVSIPVAQDEAWVSRIKKSHPGLQVRWFHRQTEEALPPDELVVGATLVCTYKRLDASLLESVRYIQLTSAGADLWTKHPTYQRKEVIFCTSNGIHPPQIAEWVTGTYLLMHRHFLDYARHQEEQVWAKSPEYLRKYAVNDSVGKRM
jgi:phosphoglycerate dehydrogenase-like enzyme